MTFQIWTSDARRTAQLIKDAQATHELQLTRQLTRTRTRTRTRTLTLALTLTLTLTLALILTLNPHLHSRW